MVCNGASNLLAGDYSLLRPLAYYSQFPYQLGTTLWAALLAQLFGMGHHFFAFEVCNALFAALLTWFLLGITQLLTESRAALTACAALCIATFPTCPFQHIYLRHPGFCRLLRGGRVLCHAGGARRAVAPLPCGMLPDGACHSGQAQQRGVSCGAGPAVCAGGAAPKKGTPAGRAGADSVAVPCGQRSHAAGYGSGKRL